MQTRDSGFDTPERAALMMSQAGREAYAQAAGGGLLADGIQLFERIVEESLSKWRLESACRSAYSTELPAVTVRHERDALAPATAVWTACAGEVESLAGQVPDNEEGMRALEAAVKALKATVWHAGDGDVQRAVQEKAAARGHLDFARRLLLKGGHHGAAAGRCDDLARRIQEAWPERDLRMHVQTQSWRDMVAAGDASRDTMAVARWYAPVLARECVRAGLDPTVIREVGNVLSSHGGGHPHLANTWPEQRARIQVLADMAELRAPLVATEDEAHEQQDASVLDVRAGGERLHEDGHVGDLRPDCGLVVPPRDELVLAQTTQEIEGEADLPVGLHAAPGETLRTEPVHGGPQEILPAQRSGVQETGATPEPGPPAGDTPAFVIDLDDAGKRHLTVNGRRLSYAQSGRGGQMTRRHAGARFLVAVALGRRPPRVDADALTDLRRGLEFATDGELTVERRGDQHVLSAPVSVADRLAKALNQRAAA